MKNIRYVILLSLFFTSCVSRLKVEIQIADRDEILRADKKYPKEIKQNPAKSIVILNNFIQEWEVTKEKKLQLILNYAKDEMGAPLANEVKEIYSIKLDSLIFGIAKNKDDAKESYINNNIDAAMESINNANLKIEELKNILLSRSVFDSDNNHIQLVKEKLNTVLNKLATTNGTVRQRFPILGDELASFIALEENEFIWKSVFNKTIASSFLGNTDIAMILRSNPPDRELKSGDYNNNFTIKGVRMDASDVTSAIFNGLTQTVNFIAVTQGVPLNLGMTPASAENPIPNQNQLVLNAQVDSDNLALKKKKLVQYKQLLLKKIELENVETGTVAEIQLKAKRISDYWEGLKIELAKP